MEFDIVIKVKRGKKGEKDIVSAQNTITDY